jgi:hypothetical protein
MNRVQASQAVDQSAGSTMILRHIKSLYTICIVICWPVTVSSIYGGNFA